MKREASEIIWEDGVDQWLVSPKGRAEILVMRHHPRTYTVSVQTARGIKHVTPEFANSIIAVDYISTNATAIQKRIDAYAAEASV